MNQRGFATLEVILMVMVIGILASIAVPRFTNITARANTAKIQADLSTIDTAIAVYQMEKGDDVTIADVKALVTAGYLQGEPKPPSGNAYVQKSDTDTNSEIVNFSETTYKINTTDKRAYLKEETYTADKFYAQRTTTQSQEP